MRRRTLVRNDGRTMMQGRTLVRNDESTHTVRNDGRTMLQCRTLARNDGTITHPTGQKVPPDQERSTCSEKHTTTIGATIT